MLEFVIALLAVALAQTAPDRVSPQAAERAVVKCGLPGKSVRVRFDRSEDEKVIWIARDIRRASIAALDCVAAVSVAIDYQVFFRDAPTQTLYARHYWRLVHQAGIDEARNWLETRNLLSTLPHPVQGEPLSNYTEAVEAFCGAPKQALLVARGRNTITFADGALGNLTAQGVEHAAATQSQFDCLMKAMAAADLEAQGIFFGFIGNGPKQR